jgi:hypothetical protein
VTERLKNALRDVVELQRSRLPGLVIVRPDGYVAYSEEKRDTVNGCAYCIDMHWKDLKAAGESDQKLSGLDAWQESPYYSARERAALEWAEAVTNLHNGHVPDHVYDNVKKSFSEKELADLTLAIIAINGWNRMNIAARTVPGTYQPAKAREMKRGA